MRIAPLAVVVALLTTLACGGGSVSTMEPAPAPEASDGSLQVDGLYQSKGTETTRYLRVYPDGHITGASSTGTPEQVAAWLGREHEYSQQGTVDLTDGAVTFTLDEGSGAVHYAGTLEPDGSVKLHWASDINGAEGDEVYIFEPVELAVP